MLDYEKLRITPETPSGWSGIDPEPKPTKTIDQLKSEYLTAMDEAIRQCKIAAMISVEIMRLEEKNPHK